MTIDELQVLIEKHSGEYPFILTEDRYDGTYSGGKWLCSFGVEIEEYENGPLAGDGDARNYWYEFPKIQADDSMEKVILRAIKAQGAQDPIPHS